MVGRGGGSAFVELPGKAPLLLPTARGRNLSNEQGFCLFLRKLELPDVHPHLL